ncbi:MAG TPA: MFS transporter [Acidimicrobiales bacterium]|nr:MFS transporter [Acidimicrobiales bacterium]
MPRLLVDITPLRTSKDFRLLFIGQLVSLLGSNLTLVAVAYEVYQLTGSSLWVGVVSFIQLPLLIMGALWGGGLGDRFDRRTLILVATFLLGLISLALGLNALQAHPNFVILVTLPALAAFFAGLTGPLRTAVIPTLVKPEELTAAYANFQIIMNGATVVGPGLAGVIIATTSVSWCFFIDGITFFALVLATFFMSPMKPPIVQTDARIFRAIGQGFRYVRQNAVVQAVYLVDLNAMVFGLPRALFPAVTKHIYHGGPEILGLLYAAPGIGALVMAIFTGWLDRVQRRGRLVVLVVLSWGVAMALFGLIHLLWIGVVCLGVAGAMDVISTVLRNTILQTSITDEYRSRLSAIQNAVVTGGPRLGDLESGAVANFTSTEFSIVSGGIMCVLGVLALIRWRPTFWRERIG